MIRVLTLHSKVTMAQRMRGPLVVFGEATFEEQLDNSALRCGRHPQQVAETVAVYPEHDLDISIVL